MAEGVAAGQVGDVGLPHRPLDRALQETASLNAEDPAVAVPAPVNIKDRSDSIFDYGVLRAK